MSVQTTIDVNVNSSGVTSLRSELRKVQLEMAGVELGSEAFNKLNQRASAIKDKMMEVNEQIAVFATGSKYEQVSNSLGEIGAGLRDMDFDRVTQGAKLFSQTAKAITFKDAIGSFKQLGSAMLSIGKTILMNPIFLIAAVIVGIGVAIYKLLERMGLLKKIFEAVGEVIGWVTQQIKDFLDWLGLTSFAAEEAAERQAAAQEKIAEAYKDRQEKVVDGYDHEIRLAKIAGKDTVDLERQKQYAIIETSKRQYEALGAQMEALRASGGLTKEKADEIRKAMLDLKKNIREARQEVQAINAQEVVDNKAKNDKIAADNAAAAKAAAEKRKQYAADRLAAQRAIQDAELELMEDGIVKELELNKVKYQRLIADTLANEKLTQAEKDRLVFNLKQNALQNELDIEKKYKEEQEKLEQEKLQAKEEAEKKKAEVHKAAAEEMAKISQEQAQKEIENRRMVRDNTIDIAGSLLAAISANVKEGSKAAKGVAIAQATIDTYKAAVSAYASAVQTPIVGPVLGPLAAAAAVAMGVANVRKIMSTDPEKGNGGVNASVTPSMNSQNGTFTPSVSLQGFNGGGTNDFGSTPTQTNVTTVVVASEIEAVNSESNNLMKMAVL